MKPQRMLSIPLSKLIRLHSDDAASDAKTLAISILKPHKSELPAALHKFSLDLFFLTLLHLAADEDKTMDDVIAFITDSAHGTELSMLMTLTDKNAFHFQNAETMGIADKFEQSIKPLSVGLALRLVAAANYQWRKAFGLLPAKEDSPLYYSKVRSAPDGKSIPHISQIRIDTNFDLSDAAVIANRFLAPVKATTDATCYAFAGNLLVALMMNIVHDQRVPKFGKVMVFLTDNRWDMHRQIFHWLAGENGAPRFGSEKFRAWVSEWNEEMLAMPVSTSENLFFRSMELYQKAMVLKDKPLLAKTVETSQPALDETPANSIQVFNLEALGRAQTLMSECKEDRRGGGDRILKSAQANNGYRTIPDARKAYEVLEQAKAEFENLDEAIEYLQHNLVLAAAMKPEKFRVRPILLLGDPGIGKTMLATTLSKSMGGGMEKISAGGSTAGFQLNGCHSSWTGSRCGQIFQALAESESTSPVVVIDEVDKMGGDNRYPVLPVLLDLLEPETAKEFRDEFFEINVDASRIIFILTANRIEDIPEPLLSRVTIFNVKRPGPEQRLRIIENEVKDLCEATDNKMNLDKVSAQKLADRVDIDLRVTASIIQEAFVKAILAKKDTVELVIKKDVYTGEKPASINRNPVFYLISRPETEMIETDGVSRTMH